MNWGIVLRSARVALHRVHPTVVFSPEDRSAHLACLVVVLYWGFPGPGVAATSWHILDSIEYIINVSK